MAGADGGAPDVAADGFAAVEALGEDVDDPQAATTRTMTASAAATWSLDDLIGIGSSTHWSTVP